MPLNGSDVASRVSGAAAVANTVAESAKYNSEFADVYAILNTVRTIAKGYTGASTAVGAHDNIVTKGVDVASASTLNLDTATGALVNVTGTTTVTAVTLGTGKTRIVRATGAFQMTASSSLIVNGSTSVNYTTTAGDLLFFEGYGSSVVRVWLIGSGAGRGFQPISETTISSAASFIVTDIDKWDVVRLTGWVHPATSGANLSGYLSTDNGVTPINSSNSYYNMYHFGTSAPASSGTGALNTRMALMDNLYSGASEGYYFEFLIQNAGNSGRYTTLHGNYYGVSAAIVYQNANIRFERAAAQVENGFQMIFSSGNISAGKIKVEGWRAQ